VTQPGERSAPLSGQSSGDELDELLGDPIVFEHGSPPPAPEPVFVMAGDRPVSAASKPKPGPEPRVSPLFWAAAIVWNLPGGVGGWWILRTTHPRTAQRVLLVGVASFVLLVLIVAALVMRQQTLYPSHIVLTG
jgi:hypothetical protein